MPTDLDGLTLAIALTAAGAAVMAGFITGLVQVFKTLLPTFIDGKEQLLAFILSGAVVIAAIADATTTGALTISIATIFAGVLAWYGIARIAMGIHDDVTRRATPLGG